MSRLLRLLYLPFSWILYLFYINSPEKDKLLMDLRRFRSVHYNDNGSELGFWKVYCEFISFAEFRSVFYFRMGKWTKLIRFMFPKPEIHLGFDCSSKNVGGGLFIQHGYCTDISVRSIGENCWINQRVTFGYAGNFCPIIGNNVRVGVGAIIIGDVTIGDNVNIGAGAVVVHDVPSNTTVVGQPARYIPKKQTNI